MYDGLWFSQNLKISGQTDSLNLPCTMTTTSSNSFFDSLLRVYWIFFVRHHMKRHNHVGTANRFSQAEL